MADPQGPDTPALLAEGMNHDTRVPCQPHSLPTPQPLYSDFYLLEIFIFLRKKKQRKEREEERRKEKKENRPGMVVHSFNPSSCEVGRDR